MDKTIQRLWKEIGGVDKANVKLEVDGENAVFKIENAPKSKAEEFEETF